MKTPGRPFGPRCAGAFWREESEFDKVARAAHEIDTQLYQEWIWRFDTLNDVDRDAIRNHIAEVEFPVPLAVFVFDANSAMFAVSAVEHLRRQLLARFHALLCFTSDCPPAAIASARHAASGDARFTFSSAPHFHDADALAGRDYVLLAAGGVLLREHALYMFMTAALQRSPYLVYADEDRLDPHGMRRYPFFKPDFSPELQQRTGYVGACVLLRGIDVDLRVLIVRERPRAVTRCIDKVVEQLPAGSVVSLPFVLYHNVLSQCQGRKRADEASLLEVDLPSVSIIIPTRDRLDLLEACLASIEEQTSYPPDKMEIVVVDNGSQDPHTLRYLRHAAERGAIRLIRDADGFNYARLNNLGAKELSGEVLVFLNNDTLADDPRWLELLVGQAMRDDVGAVGAKLLYPDRTVQFGGTILGIQGIAGHAHVGLAEDDGGYRGLATVTHEVSAVTGACLAIRRKVFEELGGFDHALAVACNDVLLCVEALKRGYRNIYLARPLLIHHELKSRGFDDTQEKRELFLDEGRYVRSRHREVFKNDPYYSPNLSYERTHDLAIPPRRDKPWRKHARRRGKLRVLMLSFVHGRGHGVPRVLRLQAEYLAREGHEVFVGGPLVSEGIVYQGCRLAHLNSPGEAAAYAVAKDIDCVVGHTAPFFSVVRFVGDRPRCILYDHGEPSSSFFADCETRRQQQIERQFCLGIADRVFAISQAVRSEIDREDVGIIRHGNSHLASWSEGLLPRRKRTRAAREWDDKVVVLNVCRFERAERRYKGIDIYAEFAKRFRETHPALAERMEFILCGKATREDIREVEALGLTVAAAVSDRELADLYAAADIYMNFSQWEGYNLGIGQALAMGLPVIASDIPAHREFGTFVTNDLAEATAMLEFLADEALSGMLLRARKPKLWTWDQPLAEFALIVEESCRD